MTQTQGPMVPASVLVFVCAGQSRAGTGRSLSRLAAGRSSPRPGEAILSRRRNDRVHGRRHRCVRLVSCKLGCRKLGGLEFGREWIWEQTDVGVMVSVCVCVGAKVQG